MGASNAGAVEPPAGGRQRRRMNLLRSITFVLAAGCVLVGSRKPQLVVTMPLLRYRDVPLPPASSSSGGTSSGGNGGSSSASDAGSSSSSDDSGSGRGSGSGSLSVAVETEQQVGDVPQPLQLQAPLPSGFRFNPVVAIVAYDRFNYFRRVVDALRRAWGSERYTLLIAIDGPPQGEQQLQQFNQQGWEDTVAHSEQLAWLAGRGHGFAAVHVHASPANLGLWANKKRAVAAAFGLSDFVVVLEDDVTVERDALRWFEWHVTSGLIFARPDLALSTCWSASFPYWPRAVEGRDELAVRELGLLDKYWTDHWAVPWGWATWRRTWDALGANWTGQDADLGRAVEARGWVENMPLVARCNNIGSVGAHRTGKVDQHIHQRATTSGSFGGLAACRYRALPRRNTSLHTTFEPLYAMVRQGIEGDGRATAWADKGLDEYQAALRQWVADQPNPSWYRSSC